MDIKPSHRLEEQEAVRTTIVGGRPPGSGKSLGPIPRGIEVLVKKASVDAQFRLALLNKRAAAAGEIGLRLEPAEAMMLNGVAGPQLDAIISATKVHPAHRGAFLGKVAAVMLAAMGLSQAGCDDSQQPQPRLVAGNQAQTRPAPADGDTAQPTDDNKIVVQIGARVEMPATAPAIDRPDVIEPQIGVRQQDLRPVRPPTTTTQAIGRPDVVAPVAGVMARPVEIQRAIRADRPPTTTTQATATPSLNLPPQGTYAGQTVIVAGAMVRSPRNPALPPATTQATTRPNVAPNGMGAGVGPDRPERIVPQDGVRPDRPPAPPEEP